MLQPSKGKRPRRAVAASPPSHNFQVLQRYYQKNSYYSFLNFGMRQISWCIVSRRKPLLNLYIFECGPVSAHAPTNWSWEEWSQMVCILDWGFIVYLMPLGTKQKIDKWSRNLACLFKRTIGEYDHFAHSQDWFSAKLLWDSLLWSLQVLHSLPLSTSFQMSQSSTLCNVGILC